MRRWFDVFPTLQAPDDDRGGGGSDTVAIDPGAEHQMDDEPADRGAPVVKKTAAEQEAEDLKVENARLKRLADQNSEDARYWADRAKRNGQPARSTADDEDTQPRRRAAAEPEVTETAAELIDDLNKKGLAALKDRGLITKAELDQALEDVRATTSEEISEARNEAVFSGRLEAEFPEMMEDSARVAKGLAPKSELFIKAGEIYRELVDLDPSLKNSRGLLLIAARQAKAAIGKTAKGGKSGDDDGTPAPRRSASDDDQQRRRQKIDRQTPDRRREDEDTDGGNHHSAEASEVMKRLKVKPEDYDKHRDRGGAKRGRN